MIRLFAAALIVTLLCSPPVHAQEYQPGRAPLAYVKEVLALPVVNYPVVLTGYLVQKTGDQKYLFQDDTGTIQAEVPEEALYNITVDGKRLTLRGNIDTEGDVLEIAVSSVTAAE